METKKKQSILAFTSVILSVIAIIVSINVAKIPFKKKLSLGFYKGIGVGLSYGLEYYCIEVINIGNKTIKLKYAGIGFYQDGKMVKFVNINNSFQPKLLNVNDSVQVNYSVKDLQEMAENNKQLYVVAYDIENKLYKKRIDKFKEF